MDDMPKQLGEAFSLNITKHPERGIAKYSDGELVVLLRTGIARDGRYTPPWMVKLPHASDEDIDSLIAFLRSDDPLVQPSDVLNRPSHPSLLVTILTHTVWKPLALPKAPQVAPPRTDKVAYGRYLMTDALECFGCHSADFKTMNLDEPARPPGYFGVDDDDIAAMYAYTRTLPKIAKKPRANQEMPLQPNASNGQKVYYKYGCNSCHGEHGVGTGDLRGAWKKYPTDDGLKAWISNAPSFKPDTKMPTWEGVIAENEYPPLMQYVRQLGPDSARDGATTAGR